MLNNQHVTLTVALTDILRAVKIGVSINLTGIFTPSILVFWCHSTMTNQTAETRFQPASPKELPLIRYDSCTLCHIPGIGPVTYYARGDVLSHILLGNKPPITKVPPISSVLENALRQWTQAFVEGESAVIPPLDLASASAFTLKVWRELMNIPFGATRTYGWVSQQLGRPGAARAVGRACATNRFPLLIPCHRVVGSDNIGGWSGPKGWKERLLNFERNTKANRMAVAPKYGHTGTNRAL